MMRNRIWHDRNQFAIAASVEGRLGWYLRHAANCGCLPIPDWAMLELQARGIRLPEGYGDIWRARPDLSGARPTGDLSGKGAA